METKLISFAENPYRILGLNVTATKKEIVSKAEELQTLIRLGQTYNPNDPLRWLGDIKLNNDLINKAVQKLSDPISRLENGLFWFWIIDNNDKTAINLISKQNFSKAELIWKTPPYPKDHYIKNIATLKYCLSLTFLDKSSIVNIEDSIKNWALYLNKTNIESILNVLGLEHINLSFGDIENIVATNLKYSLNHISNHLIKKNKADLISNLYNSLITLDLREISNNLFSPSKYFLLDKLPELKLSCIEPITKKIDSLCEAFEVIDKSKGPDVIFQETYDFHNKTKPFYEQLCKLKDQCLIQKYGDKISNIIINRAVYFGNQTNDWDDSLKLISLAGPLSKTSPTKRRYEENYKTIIGNSISYYYSILRLHYTRTIPWGKNNIYYKSIDFYNNALTYLKKAKEVNNYKLENYLSDDIAAIILERAIYIANKYHDYELSIELFHLVKPLIKSRDLSDYYLYHHNEINFRLDMSLRNKKDSRKALIWIIIGIAILAGILIIGSVCENKSDGYSSYTKPSNYIYSFASNSSASNSSYNSDIDNSNKEQLEALKATIETSKAKIKALKFQLSNLEGTLESYDSRLKSLNQEIENAETYIKLGLYDSYNNYKSNINEYNALVNKYNNTLAQYKSICAEYKKLLDQTNKNVNEYNQLMRKE